MRLQIGSYKYNYICHLDVINIWTPLHQLIFVRLRIGRENVVNVPKMIIYVTKTLKISMYFYISNP